MNNQRDRWNGGSPQHVDHPVRHEDAGNLRLVQPDGQVTTLASGWARIRGVSWHPAAREVWFTASRPGSSPSLWAVKLSGKLRLVAQYPGLFTLRDISRDGRILMTGDTRRLEMAGLIDGFHSERPLSWLDWSRVQSLSRDGKMVLFDEGGEAVGSRPATYLKRAQPDSVSRVGDGSAQGFSPDDRFVLILDALERSQLSLIPVAGGQPRRIPPTWLQYQWARFLPDGRRLIVLGGESGGPLGLLVGDAKPIAIAASMMVRNLAVSPSGESLAVLTPGGKLMLYSTSANAPPQVLRTRCPPSLECGRPIHLRPTPAVPHSGLRSNLPIAPGNGRTAPVADRYSAGSGRGKCDHRNCNCPGRAALRVLLPARAF